MRNLLQDRSYGLSIDEVNLARQALSSLAAYEGLKSGEAELYREAHPNMLEWRSFSSVSQFGMGRFKKAWGRMKAWLQKQYPEVSSTMAALFSMPHTATPPPGISHLRARALDTVRGPSIMTATGGGPSTTTTAATLQRMARTRAEAAIERNRERERSRSRPKVLPPKHIPVRQSMVAINLDAPTPVPGPTPALKADPQLPPQNFVMVVHPIWRPPPPPTMPLGPAGSTDVAAMPPGADADVVMVKAMPPPPTPTPITIPDVVVKAMPVAPAIVVKSTMHPPLPVAAAMAPAPAMAPVIALAPASSKSPITPPGIEPPLVELGTRAPGTPGSAFGVVEPWTDPDDISQKGRPSTSIAEEAAEEAAVPEAAEAAVSEEGGEVQYQKLQYRKPQYQNLQYWKLQ